MQQGATLRSRGSSSARSERGLRTPRCRWRFHPLGSS
jgi:hypothetical protein